MCPLTKAALGPGAGLCLQHIALLVLTAAELFQFRSWLRLDDVSMWCSSWQNFMAFSSQFAACSTASALEILGSAEPWGGPAGWTVCTPAGVRVGSKRIVLPPLEADVKEDSSWVTGEWKCVSSGRSICDSQRWMWWLLWSCLAQMSWSWSQDCDEGSVLCPTVKCRACGLIPCPGISLTPLATTSVQQAQVLPSAGGQIHRVKASLEKWVGIGCKVS